MNIGPYISKTYYEVITDADMVLLANMFSSKVPNYFYLWFL